MLTMPLFAGLDESESVENGSSGSPCSSRQASLPLPHSSRISGLPSGASEGEGFCAKAGATILQGERPAIALLQKPVLSLCSRLRPGHAAQHAPVQLQLLQVFVCPRALQIAVTFWCLSCAAPKDPPATDQRLLLTGTETYCKR